MKRKKNNYLFYTVLFFIVLFVYVFEQIESERSGYRISDVSRQIQSETDIQSSLKIELSRLESPKRLDTAASKMKFIVPKKEDVIYLQEKQTNETD